MYSLIIRSPGYPPQKVKLVRTQCTIGRSVRADIAIPDSFASRLHVKLRADGTTYVLEDLQSTNGSFVNGHRVERAELKDGDKVRIGPFELYFETHVPADDWVPSHIIDLSSEVHQKTIRKEGLPEGKR